MADRPHINYGGREYDLVMLDQFTINEAIVLWNYAQLSLADIPDLEGFHPGVIAAIIHVSIARVEVDQSEKSIRKAVGAIPIADLEAMFVAVSEEVDELPPSNGSAGSNGSSEPTGTSGASGGPDTAPTLTNVPATGSGTRLSATGAT